MTQQEFQFVLPERPLCADVGYLHGSYRLPKTEATTRPIIQPNAKSYVRFLVFDIDKPNSAEIVENSKLPSPTFFVENTRNGHAHVLYGLAVPVSISPSSHMAPIRLLAAIQRGITKRLSADKAYAMLLCKTPFHPQWRTVAPPQGLYDMAKMSEWLEPDEKKYDPRSELVTGLGRNCTIFETVRKMAYQKVLSFKKAGKQEMDFRKFLENRCSEINCSFEVPLAFSEIRATATSISRFAWLRFTEKRFSEIQSARGKKRWSKTPLTMELLKPWDMEGISRSLWYRRRSQKTRLSDTAKVHAHQ